MPTVRAVDAVNEKLVASVAVAAGTDMGLSQVSKDSRLASGLFALSIMVQPLVSMTLRTDDHRIVSERAGKKLRFNSHAPS